MRFCSVLALALCFSLVACAFAPAPFAPPKALAVAPGSYETMMWSGTPCGPAHFHADGTYHLLWMGDWWEGKWRCEGGTLFVEEWPAKYDSRAKITWSVKLSSPVTGDGDWRGPPKWKWHVVPKKARVD